MTDYFTSDWHVGHTKIIGYSKRPFADVDEMNAALVRNYREFVRDGDRVFFLGDMVMGDLGAGLELVAGLPGEKLLVPGNHDRVSSVHPPEYVSRYWDDYLEAFGQIIEEESTVFLDATGVRADEPPTGALSVQVSHFPYVGDSHHNDRYANRRPYDDGRWLIHGHVHEAWRVRGRQVNVGVDVWDFKPVKAENLYALLLALDVLHPYVVQ